MAKKLAGAKKRRVYVVGPGKTHEVDLPRRRNFTIGARADELLAAHARRENMPINVALDLLILERFKGASISLPGGSVREEMAAA